MHPLAQELSEIELELNRLVPVQKRAAEEAHRARLGCRNVASDLSLAEALNEERRVNANVASLRQRRTEIHRAIRG